ncbi:MAG: DUF1361 domain-containing protein [Bacteroidota bacterium]
MKKTFRYTTSFLLGTGLVLLLFIGRVLYSQSWFYGFLLWNLFLAFIPFCISQYMLRKEDMGKIKWWLCLATWLLFFPNAPYIVTDLVHLRLRNGVPLWYDAAMVFSAALTGLWIGCISLMQMEKLWRRQLPNIRARYFIASVLLLSGFGIYLGRVLRFNSWDVVTDPFDLLKAIVQRVIFPWQYLRTWGVTILFAAIIWVAYQQVKNLVYDSASKHLK